MMTNIVELHPEALNRQRHAEQTSVIGMMIALGSWGMMFMALFFIYLGLRSQTLAWPPPGLPPLPLGLPTLNTVVIACSSLSLIRALSSMREGDRSSANRWMLTTFVLGLAFVGLQSFLWWETYNQGITMATGTLGTVFYGLTVLHAVHVVAGLLVLAYLLRFTLAGRPMAGRVTTLRLCGMFWHFVGGVWAFMFVGLFLL